MSKRGTALIGAAIVTTLLAMLLAAEVIVQHHHKVEPAPKAQVTDVSFEKMKWMSDKCDDLKFEIETLEGRDVILEDAHHGTSPETWEEFDRERYQKDETDCRALKAQYNQLAAAYNAEMVRTGGRYTRKADLPGDICCTLTDRINPYANVPSPDAAAP